MYSENRVKVKILILQIPETLGKYMMEERLTWQSPEAVLPDRKVGKDRGSSHISPRTHCTT